MCLHSLRTGSAATGRSFPPRPGSFPRRAVVTARIVLTSRNEDANSEIHGVPRKLGMTDFSTTHRTRFSTSSTNSPASVPRIASRNSVAELPPLLHDRTASAPAE